MKIKSIEELWLDFLAFFPVNKIEDGKVLQNVLWVGFYSGIAAVHEQMYIAQTEASDLERMRYQESFHNGIINFKSDIEELNNLHELLNRPTKENP